ncbi:MAG: DUF72 domain-containing protein [Acidobacteria bacterium]|nr:MAG: DUF72 domain-containing protein [Acidobacteriota bacterium]
MGRAAMGALHIGTSGWTYDDWSGRFYPEEVRGTDRLAYYASVFDTVEINATFYRFPTQVMIDSWNRRLPARFHLVVKGHRRITHLHKLDPAGDESLRGFLERVAPLRALRVVLWQLPPSLHADPERLASFLERLDRATRSVWSGRHRLRHAIEFRHRSWWEDDRIPGILAGHRAAFVAVSHPRLPPEVIPTADFLYVRFHGTGPRLYDHDYPREELRAWAKRLAPHLGRRALYAFFNNDWHAHAPKNAQEFREILERIIGRTARRGTAGSASRPSRPPGRRTTSRRGAAPP